MGSSSSNNRDEIFKKYLKPPPTIYIVILGWLPWLFGMKLGLKWPKIVAFHDSVAKKNNGETDIATLVQENLKEGISSEKAWKTPKTAQQIVYHNTLPIYSHYKPKHIITYKEPKKHSYIKSSSVFSFWSFQIWEKNHEFVQPFSTFNLSFPGGVVAWGPKIGKGATLTFVHQVGTIFPQTSSGWLLMGWFFFGWPETITIFIFL